MTSFPSLFVRIFDAVLPPRCLLTGEIVDRQGMIAPEGWRRLDFIAAPFCQCCGVPFEHALEGVDICSRCQEDPPPFVTHRSALVYNEASKRLVLGFKYGDKTHAARSFAPWLARIGADMLARADILIPVPLHYKRLVSRRYNQAALMTQALSRETGLASLSAALLRVRYTPSQGHLSLGARHKNVDRAFALNPKYRSVIEGKTLVLVDDVYTTGATLKECTKALLAAGAQRVDALSLARVVHRS